MRALALAMIISLPLPGQGESLADSPLAVLRAPAARWAIPESDPAAGLATSRLAGLAPGARKGARRRPAPEPAFVVVLDPGHGGDKEGAIGPGGVREKEVALQIARRVGAQLKRQGGRVVLTRSGDVSVPLALRAALANAERADLFVSIHLNAMPGTARAYVHGVETYFLSADASDASATAVAARENADRLAGEAEIDPNDPVSGILQDLADTDALAESSRLAYAVHEVLVRRLGAEDRGVKQAPFYVLAGARMPAVLLEVGFVSHAAESRKLVSPAYQEQVAQAVADGVAAWRAATKHARR